MNFIHIAGTNGKGSCTRIVSNILHLQGYKVGTFISPHLIRYNERISINNKEISDDEMIELIDELEPLINKYNEMHKNNNVTYFELITIVGLLYFYRKNVDFVVLETGLGGLLDCTNVITKPLVSIITSIGYDHTKILGNSLIEIAYQKAGIIKQNSNTVIFHNSKEVDDVFISECEKKNNELSIISDDDIENYEFNSDFQKFDYKDLKNCYTNLKGKMQVRNSCLSIEAIRILKSLGYEISDENIKKGLSTVINNGRMECLNEKPLIVFDGAHNESAICCLEEMVKMYYENVTRVYIISFLKRKDYDKMLKILSEDSGGIFILTSGNNSDEFASSEELYNCMKNYVNEEKIYKKDLKQAIEDAMIDTKECVNLIIGSFYVYKFAAEKLCLINDRS